VALTTPTNAFPPQEPWPESIVALMTDCTPPGGTAGLDGLAGRLANLVDGPLGRRGNPDVLSARLVRIGVFVDKPANTGESAISQKPVPATGASGMWGWGQARVCCCHALAHDNDPGDLGT
jgi:hypothetical protein